MKKQKMTLLIFFIIVLSLAYFVFYIPLKTKSGQSGEDQRISDEKATKQKKEEKYATCLQEADEHYHKSRDKECKSRGLTNSCGLPFEVESQLQDTRLDDRVKCYREHENN